MSSKNAAYPLSMSMKMYAKILTVTTKNLQITWKEFTS